MMFPVLAIALAAITQAGGPVVREFRIDAPAEVVATIAASCAPCDWGAPGRETVILELSLDGAYSQHLALIRGGLASQYRVMLGRLAPGTHRLTLVRDAKRSARGAGAATIGEITFQTFTETSPEFAWLSRAPFLRARPGTVERFSDFPLLMYAETDVTGERGTPFRYQYTVIFTNEDGGTATDRLMATWGRTTDIEFVYGITAAGTGATREEIQAEGHKWIEFAGPRVLGAHPVLWVATDNNMVADHGPDDAIRFAPAPEMVDLRGTARETVMDERPWTYAVTSAEMSREGRVDPKAQAGSGRIPDPRRYLTIEACGDVRDATLAFDVGVRRGGAVQWVATDRGEPKFRIARGGCFRGGTPLPDGMSVAEVSALRVRAYTRPPGDNEAPLPAGSGSVVLTSVNRMFMLDDGFVPALSSLRWKGTLPVKVEGGAVDVPVR